MLRQTALIVVLEQMGSFVPAKEAKIGYVDKIFSRVGASVCLPLSRRLNLSLSLTATPCPTAPDPLPDRSDWLAFRLTRLTDSLPFWLY